MKIKAVLCDIDGTLTDGGLYYTSNGDTFKRFNCKDGQGLANLRDRGIILGFISGSNCKSIEHRANNLKIPYVFKGLQTPMDKLTAVMKIAKKSNISLSEIAYLGDDWNDLEVLKVVGLAASPLDSSRCVIEVLRTRQGPSIVIPIEGGSGAFRELSDLLIAHHFDPTHKIFNQ